MKHLKAWYAIIIAIGLIICLGGLAVASELDKRFFTYPAHSEMNAIIAASNDLPFDDQLEKTSTVDFNSCRSDGSDATKIIDAQTSQDARIEKARISDHLRKKGWIVRSSSGRPSPNAGNVARKTIGPHDVEIEFPVSSEAHQGNQSFMIFISTPRTVTECPTWLRVFFGG